MRISLGEVVKSHSVDNCHAFLSYLDSIFDGLHTQAALLHRCTTLHPEAPASLEQVAEQGIAELVSATDGIREKIRFAAVASGWMKETDSQGTTCRMNLDSAPRATPESVVPTLMLPKQGPQYDSLDRYCVLLLQRMDNWMMQRETCHEICASPLRKTSEQTGGTTDYSIAPTKQVSFCDGPRKASISAPSTDTKSEGSMNSRRRDKKAYTVDIEAEDERRKMQAQQIELQLDNRSVKSSDEDTTWAAPVRRLVKSFAFEMFFAAWIIANSLMLGAEVEYALERPGEKTPTLFYVFRFFCTFLFFIELTLRFVAAGLRAFFCSDQWAWNYLDIIIVSASLVEAGVDIVELGGGTKSTAGRFANMRIIRIVRVTRLIRIIRITKVLSFVRALRTMVHSIVSTFKPLIWAITLLLLIMYIFGIVFAQEAGDYLHQTVERNARHLKLQKYFGSLPLSMLTLFKALTGGIDWDILYETVSQLGSVMGALFVLYIAFGMFVFLNVVTGVFCQTAIDSAQHDHEMIIQAQVANKNMYVKRIKQLFKRLDDDDSGVITLNELEKNFELPGVRDYFNSLDIDIEDAWTLFKLLDTDETNVIDLEELIEGCLRLKGTARSIDIAKLMHEHQWMRNRFTVFANDWDEWRAREMQQSP